MAAAGAADGNGKTVLALLDVLRQQVLYHIRQLIHENLRLLEAENIAAHILIKAAVVAHILDVIGVGQKADIEHEVCVQRHTVLKAEAHNIDHDGAAVRCIGKIGVQLILKLTERQVRGVYDVIGKLPYRLELLPLTLNGVLDRAAGFYRQRVGSA